jgi:phosphate transport system substrate-binding protein
MLSTPLLASSRRRRQECHGGQSSRLPWRSLRWCSARAFAAASSTGGSLKGAGSFIRVPARLAVAGQLQERTDHVRIGRQRCRASRRSPPGTVDFGASDAPLTKDQASACNGCQQIPWALSATSIPYHVPGIAYGLKLTGKILANIYLGHITKWNDSSIKKINPGVNLRT